jgi:type II secretory pathway component GspD/PulD (secretin)
MMGWIVQGIKIVAAIVLAMTLLAGAAFAQTNLPWSTQSLITLTAEGETIKDVLRTILRSNRMVAIFKGKVDGTVDLDEEDVPALGIFNKLISEFDLQFAFDEGTRTVTIQPKRVAARVAKEAAPIRDFLVPQYVSFTVIRSVLQKFGLGAAGITYDEASGTISLFGKAGRIQDIKVLIEQLDKSAEGRQEREMVDLRSKYEGKLYGQLLSAKVKVIRLRYASVGVTTKTFQGKSVAVPGIEDTLQAILGVKVQKSGDADTGPSQADLAFGNQGSAAAGSQRGLGLNQASALFRLKQLTRPTISIDQRTNSVIVRGSALAIAEVEAVIRQLDQPQKMLEIQVVILNAAKGVTEQLGIDFRALRRTENNKRGFGIDTGTSGDLLASFIVAGSKSFLQVQLAALSADNRSQVIASPKLITLDNVSASITRSASIFVQIPESGSLGQDLKEVQTGLSINILPTVVPSDIAGQEQFVRLSFNATNSTPAATSLGQISVTAQEIQTEVLIPDGGTYVVGGLFDDTRTEQVSGLPGLRDLPIIGRLFRSNASSDALEETIFLITPRIVRSEELLSKDIATRVGTREYMNRQQAAMDRLKTDISAPKDKFPYALRHLVEDE